MPQGSGRVLYESSPRSPEKPRGLLTQRSAHFLLVPRARPAGLEEDTLL